LIHAISGECAFIHHEDLFSHSQACLVLRLPHFISFYWKAAKTGIPIRKNPSPTGYGLWAEPQPGEFDYAQHCIEKGNWHIGYDEVFGNWGYDKADYTFDGARTREMLRLLVEHPSIEKILIQPDLKKRLNLEQYAKVRAQGCQAARHDDHVHVQLK